MNRFWFSKQNGTAMPLNKFVPIFVQIQRELLIQCNSNVQYNTTNKFKYNTYPFLLFLMVNTSIFCSFFTLCRSFGRLSLDALYKQFTWPIQRANQQSVRSRQLRAPGFEILLSPPFIDMDRMHCANVVRGCDLCYCDLDLNYLQ